MLFGALPAAANLAFHGAFLAVAAIGLLTNSDTTHRLLAGLSLLFWRLG